MTIQRGTVSPWARQGPPSRCVVLSKGMGFGHLERCGQLDQADLEVAVGSRADCWELLSRMGEIAAPDTGVPAMLSMLDKMADAQGGPLTRKGSTPPDSNGPVDDASWDDPPDR